MSDKTAFVSEIPTATDIDEVIFITPGEGMQAVLLLGDEFCECPTHPHLISTGKFGYKTEREIQISPSRYFNQRHWNYYQKFASDSDYIFFAHSLLQKLQLNSRVKIVMRKVACITLTTGMLSKNFKRYSSLLEKVFARSIGNGEAIRNTKILLNSFMCWFMMEWINISYI